MRHRSLERSHRHFQRAVRSGLLCEPDSREPRFISGAHDEACLSQTIEQVADGLDATLKEHRG